MPTTSSSETGRRRPQWRRHMARCNRQVDRRFMRQQHGKRLDCPAKIAGARPDVPECARLCCTIGCDETMTDATQASSKPRDDFPRLVPRGRDWLKEPTGLQIEDRCLVPSNDPKTAYLTRRNPHGNLVVRFSSTRLPVTLSQLVLPGT